MKKMTNEPILERFKLWIQPDHFEVVAKQATVIEPKRDAQGRPTDEIESEVHCYFDSQQVIHLKLEGKECAHLISKKCVDGIFAVQNEDETWDLHVMECKRTIKESKWKKVKYQFEASILRAVGILTGLGIQVSGIQLYTAVQYDLLTPKIESDPTLARMNQTGWNKLSSEDQEKMHYLDWMNTELELWVKKNIPHQIIILDESGKGEVHLCTTRKGETV